MSCLNLALVSLICAFFAGMIIAPAYLKLARKRDEGQTILSYVSQHNDKQGTPTMGGVIFIFSAIIVGLALGGYDGSMAVVLTLIMFAYGLVGFLDDYLKVRQKRNLGLKAYQKIIFQLAIAVIAAFYAAKSDFIGTAVRIPIAKTFVDFGWAYIPFAVVAFVAMSNAVNLTDGLDGLAGTVNAVYFTAFLAIILFAVDEAVALGDALYAKELRALATVVAALIGGLLAFLWFNTYKAKCFMGDTGSLALGGTAIAVALFVKNPLISVLIGIMPVISCLSVIIQVISFKLRKKRVFLMAPYHHHLELKGMNESRIVGIYAIITIIASAVSLIIY